MFCPQCGQRQAANDVRFCSSCGFQLNVVSDLLTTGGVLTGRAVAPAGPRKLSPRSKGMRQGAMLMLSTMLIVPLVALIFYGLLGLPGEVVGITAISCFAGGLLRIIYAALFEDKYAADEPPAPYAPAYAPPPAVPSFMNPPARGAALPPPSSTPAPTYQPPRRVNTGEVMQRPPSVTENTTRLLGDQPEDTPNQ
jgi:hypothetical protein